MITCLNVNICPYEHEGEDHVDEEVEEETIQRMRNHRRKNAVLFCPIRLVLRVHPSEKSKRESVHV